MICSNAVAVPHGDAVCANALSGPAVKVPQYRKAQMGLFNRKYYYTNNMRVSPTKSTTSAALREYRFCSFTTVPESCRIDAKIALFGSYEGPTSC